MQNSARGILSLIFLVLLSLTLLAPQSAHASDVLVQTQTGKAWHGRYVQETDTVLTIEVGEDEVLIPISQITDFRILTNPESIFKQKRAKITSDDYDARYDLAYEMFIRDQYDLAAKELKRILKYKPNNTKCRNLLNYIEKNKAEAEAALKQSQEKAREYKASRKFAKKEPKKDPFAHLITDEDVWLIRLWELPADVLKERCIVQIPKKHIDALFKMYSDDKRVPIGKKERYKFKGKKGYEQLDLIFKLNARDLYRGIIVRDDPKALYFYRRKLNANYVSRYFKKHFGNGVVPGLQLFNKHSGRAREAYTNFLVLNNLQYQNRPFIDRQYPEKSLRLQWGLPRTDAIYPAPKGKNWKPFFKGSNDPRFIEAVEWIKTLYQALPDPTYGVKYTVPKLREQQSHTVDKPESDSNISQDS